MSDLELERSVEAILMVVDEPVTELILAQVLDRPVGEITLALSHLHTIFFRLDGVSIYS